MRYEKNYMNCKPGRKEKTDASKILMLEGGFSSSSSSSFCLAHSLKCVEKPLLLAKICCLFKRCCHYNMRGLQLIELQNLLWLKDLLH